MLELKIWSPYHKKKKSILRSIPDFPDRVSYGQNIGQTEIIFSNSIIYHPLRLITHNSQNFVLSYIVEILYEVKVDMIEEKGGSLLHLEKYIHISHFTRFL